MEKLTAQSVERVVTFTVGRELKGAKLCQIGLANRLASRMADGSLQRHARILVETQSREMFLERSNRSVILLVVHFLAAEGFDSGNAKNKLWLGPVDVKGVVQKRRSRRPYSRIYSDDKRASKRSLVKAANDHQPPSDPATRRLVQEFMNNKTAKRVQPSDLGKGSDFKRLILIYRQISADSAHVTLTALGRHVRADGDGG